MYTIRLAAEQQRMAGELASVRDREPTRPAIAEPIRRAA
jgi:hypothetical protein